MNRIDHSTATAEGQFTGGNPGARIPPTVVTAAWLNGVQEEMCRLIEAQGITLDPEDQDQLAAAILTMIVGELATLTIADVAGLQAALDDKAAVGHDHDAVYLGIAAQAADSFKLDGQTRTEAATPNSVMSRDINGDVSARKFWGELEGTATSARYA